MDAARLRSSAAEGVWRLVDPKITMASVASLFLGAAGAGRSDPLSWWWLALSVLGVFFIEVAKNASGEVVDFDSGADAAVAPAPRGASWLVTTRPVRSRPPRRGRSGRSCCSPPGKAWACSCADAGPFEIRAGSW